MEWVWNCRDHVLTSAGAPYVMGILNVTPDSFSDGGRFASAAQAVDAGLRMLDEGAEILDVGGESTRPGASPVPEDEEARRVIPVIEGLCRQRRAVISVDTMKAAVAERALAAGASIVNDVSALTADARMADVVRTTGAGAILMHMRGTPRTMQDDPRYANVAGEVLAWLEARREALVRDGVEAARMAVDPGIGFGKTPDHNLQLLAGLGLYARRGWPVVAGVSRKSVLGRITGRDVGDRLPASLAAAFHCAAQGAAALRVHDVAATVDVVRVWRALRAASRGEAVAP